MSKKRMFSQVITNSSRFLMMPQSAQNIYFHLGMNADDDGFVEHFTVMRMTESKPDDLKILQAKEFVMVFDDKVLIVLDWKENNYIRSDRYTESKYLKLYKEEIKLLANSTQKDDKSGIPDVNQDDNQTSTKRETQYSIDKIRLDKIRKDTKVNGVNHNTLSVPNNESSEGIQVNHLIGLFYEANKELITDSGKFFNNPFQRKAVIGLIEKFGFDKVAQFTNAAIIVQGQSFAPQITKPTELRDKLTNLKIFYERENNKGGRVIEGTDFSKEGN